MGAERIMLLKVPLDIVAPEELPDVINNLISSKGNPQPGGGRDIVLLSVWDLLRARRKGEYRKYVMGASLVLPISMSLVSGARFLTGKKVIRYMPFNFVISLLTLLERREDSVFLLGGKSHILKKTEKNLHTTFPRLKIVGRHSGVIRKQDEGVITEAIRKASPALLLAGKGVRGEELWIARNSNRLNTLFRLWCSDLFEVFAESRRRPSDTVFNLGLESLYFCFRNPFKFLRIFPYLRYKLLLLFYRMSGS